MPEIPAPTTSTSTCSTRSEVDSLARSTVPVLMGAPVVGYPNATPVKLLSASGGVTSARGAPGGDRAGRPQWIPTMDAQTQLEAPAPPSHIRAATASCSALLAR